MTQHDAGRLKFRSSRRRFLELTLAGSAAYLSQAFLPTGACAADAAGSLKPVFLTDLSRCQPASALSEKPKRHRWRLLDYEADGMQGVMLVAGQNTAAPEISLALEQRGWYAISLGLRSAYGDTQLEVRLASDSTWSIVTHRDVPENHRRIDELYWKTVELHGEPILFRQICTRTVPENAESAGNPCTGVWLAYVKLVPLAPAEVDPLIAERRDRKTCTLFAHNDAWSDHYQWRPTTADEIRRMVEPYRDTDFSRLYWEGCHGDRCNYFTQIGLMPSLEWSEDFYRVGDRLAAESWRILRQKNIDPFRVALEHTHAIGLEFHAALRTTGFHFPVPEEEWNVGGAYDKHPEWRGTDRQGKPTPRLSYAFPEFRKYVVSLLREMAGYPIDGVCLLYNRRPPFLEYEPPVVEAFRKEYGKDPRQLDERDPQWLAHRATTMTQFMREVRAAMLDAARQHGRESPLGITAIVMSTREENLYYGLDLEAWVREQLVDTLIPYTSVPKLTSSADSWMDPSAAEFFLRITRGTSCQLALNLMPRQLSAEAYFERAHRLYSAGVQHLCFWDTNSRHDYGRNWSALRRLGHREEIAAWVQSGSPPLPRPGRPLNRLGDWDLGYATPG